VKAPLGLLRTSRRQVMTGGALAAAAVAASGAGAGTPKVLSWVAAVESASVVLHDPLVPMPHDVRQRLGASGASLVALEADPVRQWRGDQALLLGARATRLLGVTRWPAFLLVRGLAEESGRRVRYQRVDATTGAITWLIA
jgi:hypothetical protein